MGSELINTDGLSQALIVLADKLGIGLQQMYAIYVSAQQVMAAVHIAFTIMTVIGIVIIMFGMKKYYDTHKSERYCDGTGLFCILGATALGFVFIFAMAELSSAFVALLCPQYTALHAMMGDISNLIGRV